MTAMLSSRGVPEMLAIVLFPLLVQRHSSIYEPHRLACCQAATL